MLCYLKIREGSAILKDHEWIPKNELMRENGFFKPCPYCGGEIIEYVWRSSIDNYPFCKECRLKFIPQKKYFIIEGFAVKLKS